MNPDASLKSLPEKRIHINPTSMARSDTVFATLTPANVLAKPAFDELVMQSTAQDGASTSRRFFRADKRAYDSDAFRFRMRQVSHDNDDNAEYDCPSLGWM